MSRQNWADGQVIASDDLNKAVLGVEQTILEQVLKNLLQNHEGFVDDSFKIIRAGPTTFTASAGFGLYSDSAQVTPESKFRLLHNTTPGTIYTITNPHATLSRIDIVQLRSKIETETSATRDVKNGVGTVAPQTVVIRQKWTFELMIKDGTASASPVAPSADAGWVKVGTMIVSPGVTGIANQAAITDNRVEYYLFDEVAQAIIDTNSSIGAINTSLGSRITTLETFTADVANQTTDLWTWDLPQMSGHVTSVNANTNDLDIKRVGAAGASTYAGAFIETTYGSMLMELLDIWSRGLTLRVLDNSGVIWLLVPKANLSTYYTHVALSGGMIAGSGGGTCTLKIKASGVGVLFDLYKNGVSTPNFSTLSTVATVTSNTFRIVVFGTSKLLRMTNGVPDIQLIKKRYIRVLFPMLNTLEILNSTIAGFKATFRVFRPHQLLVDVLPFPSAQNFGYGMVINHLSSSNNLSHQQLAFLSSYTANFGGDGCVLTPSVINFVPTESDFNFSYSINFSSFRSAIGLTNDLSWYATNRWAVDKFIIEEV